MPIKQSGSLSLSEINTEFGRGRNLNSYRGVTYYNSDGTSGTFSSGSISISNFYGKAASRPSLAVDYIIVGGGGGGGSGIWDNIGGGGCGGGGGSVYTGSINLFLSSSALITIGAGGTKGYYGPTGQVDGYGNPIYGIIAAGRGGATQFSYNDSSEYLAAYGGFPGTPGTGTYKGGAGGGLYNDGGGYHSPGKSDGIHAGGGGGGVDDANNTLGVGGNGPLLFDGNYYSGGGGGGGDYSTGAAGGLGGGGAGGIRSGVSVQGGAGSSNTGGGGGGGASYGGSARSDGGDGGSGVLVLRYIGSTNSQRLSFASGTVVNTYQNGSYVYHYIRSNGRFTVS